MKIYSQINPLNSAIQTNNLENIKLSLENGAQPDYKSLSYAIKTNNLEIIRLVLQCGASPSSDCFNYAIQTKNIEIVNLVLEAGAKVDDNGSEVSLTQAIGTKNIEIINLVLEAGAKVNNNCLNTAMNTQNAEIIKLIMGVCTKPYSSYYGSRKFVWLAILSKSLEIVKDLIDNGVAPDKYCLGVAIDTKNVEIVKLVVKAGAQPDDNSLHGAISTNSIEIIKLVLETGVKIGWNELSRVIRERFLEAVKLFLELGAQPDDQLLYQLILSNDLEMVKLIAGGNERIFVRGSLSEAIKTGNLEMVKLVIGGGAEVDEDSIYLSSLTKNQEIVKLVTEYAKADINYLICVTSARNYFDLQESLTNYEENFSRGKDIFKNASICEKLSKFTEKPHYDKIKFHKRVFERLEEFKKDHKLEVKLTNFSKIIMNQLKYFEHESGFHSWLNGLIGSSGLLNSSLESEYKKEIENWLLEMSTKSLMINEYENLFTLSSFIPTFIEQEKKKLFDAGMEKIIEKYPQPSRDRMEARKKLENTLKSSTKIIIKKENLKEIKLVQTDEDFKRMKLDSQLVQKSQIDLFEKLMKNLILENDSTYEEKHDFVLRVLSSPREARILPQEIKVNVEGRDFLFKILGKEDPLGIVVGDQTYSGCCYKIGGESESSLLESYINPDTGNLVVYDSRGSFLAQSWIWLTKDKKSLVLDNIEFSTKFKNSENEGFSEESYLMQIFNKNIEKTNKVDIGLIIQIAYKEFAKIYKQQTGLNILVGTGYDGLGLDKMNLEKLQEWDFYANYPKIQDYPYKDSESVLKLANWYKQYKISFGKNEI